MQLSPSHQSLHNCHAELLANEVCARACEYLYGCWALLYDTAVSCTNGGAETHVRYMTECVCGNVACSLNAGDHYAGCYLHIGVILPCICTMVCSDFTHVYSEWRVSMIHKPHSNLVKRTTRQRTNISALYVRSAVRMQTRRCSATTQAQHRVHG
jgi:hypothetical protein